MRERREKMRKERKEKERKMNNMSLGLGNPEFITRWDFSKKIPVWISEL